MRNRRDTTPIVDEAEDGHEAACAHESYGQ